MSSTGLLRAYVPVYGDESSSSSVSSSSQLYYPIDLQMPCQPKSTGLYSLMGADVAMSLISMLCVAATVVLVTFAMRAVWRAKTIRDVAVPPPSGIDVDENTSAHAESDASDTDDSIVPSGANSLNNKKPSSDLSGEESDDEEADEDYEEAEEMEEYEEEAESDDGYADDDRNGRV